MKRLLTFASLVALLAGCAGTAMQSTPATSPAGGDLKLRRTGIATIRIRVPKKVRRAGRVPKYVSPATKGMTIAVGGPTSVNVTVALTPSATGCTSTSTNTICQLALTLTACPTSANCYTATIKTYDKVSCTTGCTIPGGANELSAAQTVPFHVAAGGSTAIPLTLSGIPASIVAAPLDVFTLAQSYPGSGYGTIVELVGLGPHAVIVQALDPDGNIIVGPGSPAFTITDAKARPRGIPPITVTIAPLPGWPTAFTLTPQSTYGAGLAPLTITATYAGQPTDGCAQAGANCFAPLTASMAEMLVVADSTGGFGQGQVRLFALGDSKALAQLTTGINDPVALAADPNGNIFIGNGTGQSVVEYPAASTTRSARTFSGLPAQPVISLAADPSGNVYVGTSAGGGVGAVNEFGASGNAPIGGITVGGPVSMTCDANGRLYVADSSSHSLREYDSLVLKVNVTGFGGPSAVAVGSGATPEVYVADAAGGALWRFPYNSSVSNGDLGASQSAPNPSLVALDGKGNVYATNTSANSAQWVATGAWPVSSTATYAAAGSGASALAADPAGYLLIANPSASFNYLFAPNTSTYPSLEFVDFSATSAIIVP